MIEKQIDEISDPEHVEIRNALLLWMEYQFEMWGREVKVPKEVWLAERIKNERLEE